MITILVVTRRARQQPMAPSAGDVARSLRDFIDGAGGDWDWDDFIATPLSDARLDSIRHRAAQISLPASADGNAELRTLLTEAEALAQGQRGG